MSTVDNDAINGVTEALEESRKEQPTRRERIATAALQGLLAGDYAEAEGMSHEGRARDAVKYADALIAELDRDD